MFASIGISLIQKDRAEFFFQEKLSQFRKTEPNFFLIKNYFINSEKQGFFFLKWLQ